MNEREFECALGQWRVEEVPTAMKSAPAPRKMRMLLPTLGATGLLVVVVMSTTFIPGKTLARGPISLAEMARAAKKVKYYSSTYSRFMGPEKGGGFRFCSQVTPTGSYVQVKHFGGRESNDTYSYLENKSLTEVHPRRGYAVVSTYQQLIEMGSAQPTSFEYERWLYDRKRTTVTANVQWRGRSCTRYRYKATRGKIEVLQEIYVDTETRLPLFHLNSRPKEGWRDETEFNYSTPLVAERFRKVPPGLRIYNTSQVRESLLKTCNSSKSNVAAVLVSEFGQIGLLLKRPISVSGAALSKASNLADTTSPLKEMHNSEWKGCALLGGKPYYILDDDNPQSPEEVQTLKRLTRMSGPVLVKQYREKYLLNFNEVPVVHIPELQAFLEPLYDAYWKAEKLKKANSNKSRG